MYQFITIKSGDNLLTLDALSGTAVFAGGAEGAKKTITIDLNSGAMSITDQAHPKRGISLDINKCSGGGQDRTLSIAETAVCETENGAKVTKHRLQLMSETY